MGDIPEVFIIVIKTLFPCVVDHLCGMAGGIKNTHLELSTRTVRLNDGNVHFMCQLLLSHLKKNN